MIFVMCRCSKICRRRFQGAASSLHQFKNIYSSWYLSSFESYCL